MTREPIIEHLKFDRDVRCGDKYMVAEAFRNELENNLGEKIFDGGFGQTIATAELYVDKREGKTDGAAEQELHRLYSTTKTSHPQLVSIVASEGYGKSTFIRYYFDYLRHTLEPLKQIEKQVIFYCDLRHSPTVAAMQEALYELLRNQIVSKFPYIGTEDKHAMWNRKAVWADPIHGENFEKTEYRNEYVRIWYKDDRIFVEEALRYLCSKRRDDGKRCWYISIVFDNLDQQPLEGIQFAWQLILSWLGDRIIANSEFVETVDARSIDLWRVILPMRPETFGFLRLAVDPVERISEIFLSHVSPSEIIERRCKQLALQVRNSRRQVDLDVVDSDGIVSFEPIANYAAAERLGSTVKVKSSNPRVLSFVERFCGGNNRRLLRFRKRLVQNGDLGRQIERQLSYGREVIASPYALINSWLCCKNLTFDPDDKDCDLLNVFDVSGANDCEHSTLLGPHVLQILSRGTIKKSFLFESLVNLGYLKQEIEHCLELFYRKAYFKPSAINWLNDDCEIVPENTTILGLLDLIVEPAYIDNVALLTPIDHHIFKDIESTALGTFTSQVQVTLCFLRQLKKDEDKFEKWQKISSRYQSTSESEFRLNIEKCMLPSFYSKAAFKYQQRLTGLRDDLGSMPQITGAKWSGFLDDPVLKVTKGQSKRKLRAFSRRPKQTAQGEKS